MPCSFWFECLTFDVRGGPLAGRPLDGGVRCNATAPTVAGNLQTAWRSGSEQELRVKGAERLAICMVIVTLWPMKGYLLTTRLKPERGHGFR
jgi:hypothetical protein